MFLDEIEKRYPERWLRGVELGHAGFDAYFDVPEERRLTVHIYLFKQGEKQLEVYETVQELGSSRMHFSDGNHCTIEADEVSLLSTLTSYLKKAIGDFNEHSYEGSFVGWLLEQACGGQDK